MKMKIVRECSDFLHDSEGHPLVKFLSAAGPDSRKIKIRKRKSSSEFDESFNKVFINHPDLRQRCVFANGIRGLTCVSENFSAEGNLDAFYIFPINGFKFIYSPNVYISSIQYKETLEMFIEVMGDGGAIPAFSEVLKYDYISEKFAEGLSLGSEMILYGLQYYYAIRKSTINSYSTLFSL